MSERSSMEWQLEAFESRTSLWRLIEEFVPESERLEIKEALGEDLVDETLDLQNEVSSYFRSCTCTCMDRLITVYDICRLQIFQLISHYR